MKTKKLKTVSTKRKTAYAMNPAIAKKAKQASNTNYRKEKGKDFELSGSTVLRSLDFLDIEVKPLKVFNQLTGNEQVMPVIRLIHAAKLFNVSYQTLWRWMSETNQFPQPVLVDTSMSREYTVFHVEEMRVMIRVIGEHLRRYKYYRKDHTETRDKLFDEVNAVRSTHLTNTKGSKHHGTTPHRKVARRKSKSKRTK